MKAVVAIEQGTPDVLRLVEQPVPAAGPGRVLIKVVASAVNHIDTKVRRADLPMTPRHFPAVLQSDFSGVVVALGEEVTRFAVGDEVYGFAGGFKGPHGDVPGALSEYMLADACLIAPKPRNLDFRQAAALPLVAATAWRALHEKVRIEATTRLLIQGGVGGVGHVALQLARAAGVRVVTTVTDAEGAALARRLGADVALIPGEHTPQEIVERYTDGAGFDVILDTVGGPALDAAFRMIRPTGDVITTVGAASHDLAPLYLRGANLHTVLVLVPIMFGQGQERQGQILERIALLAEQGKVVPRLDPRRFTLETVAEAHRKLEARQASGKLVIDVASADTAP